MSPPAARTATLATALLAIAALCLFGSPAAATDTEADAVADAANAEADATVVAQDPRGFLYGRVDSRLGILEGRLRWGDEESAWDDHLNGSRYERPFADLVPDEERGRRREVRVFGIRVGSRWEAWDSTRQLVVRFGSVAAIERRGRRHLLTMKGGAEIALKGGSNDLRGSVTVWDRERGETELDFAEIDRIDFLPTPTDLEVDEHRLFGTVTTTAGSFTGHIQWDEDESLSVDILDGDDRQGKRRKIPLGEVRRIAHRSSSSAEVTLVDNTVLVLDGTNDVDSSNRGIVVEDPRYGRVTIDWSTFDRVDFERPTTSGAPYGAYPEGRFLQGTVTTGRGRTHRGRIVYDIDETGTWDMLNAEADGLEYDIPFELVRAVERLDDERSRVYLAGDLALDLGGTVDVGEGNAGLLVITGDGGSTYLRWEDVRRIDFDE